VKLGVIAEEKSADWASANETSADEKSTEKTIAEPDEKKVAAKVDASVSPTDIAEANAEVKTAMDEEQKMRMLKSFKGTDIDLFLVTRDPDKALWTIIEFYHRLRRAIPKKYEIPMIRTDQSVTFMLPWPYRNIQIVTRLYHSVEHVLLGFDIDCCCVAYDGKRVIALPRATRALQTRTNLIDTTRQSTTYESRLLKYTKRGFAVAVPGLDVAGQMGEVLYKIGAAKRGQDQLMLTGAQLLLGMLHAVNDNDRFVRKRLNVRLSDYANVQTRGIYGLITKASQGGAKPSFVYGNDIIAVLQGNQCRYDWHDGGITCFSSCSPAVSFQVQTPHVQNRVDRLFTGAFDPTFDAWFG
jgi:hypothetical protein